MNDSTEVLERKGASAAHEVETIRILITDPLDDRCASMLEAAGMEAETHLKKSPDELRAIVGGFDGWLIRSGTRITADLIDAADRMQIIGRAGVGVDNVDLEAATRKGILVVNAPDGNTISTAEHACAMLMALARKIPQANRSLLSGAWDRKSFTGSELFGKTLGIVGVGKIGRSVAERMLLFGMTVIGFDPVLSQEVAERLGIELVPLEDIFRRADFISVHTPLTSETKGMFNRETLARCKKGVRLVNCARGGIIEEQALLDFVERGHVAGAAIDVFSSEPPPDALRALIEHPNVVATPHIAASTAEAQEKVAEQVTEQVIDALSGRPVASPVNAVAIRMASQPEVQPFLTLADKIGQLAGQLVDGSLQQVTVKSYGDAVRRYSEIVAIAGLRGVLSRWKTTRINYVNAPVIAEEMGLRFSEQWQSATGNFTSLVEVLIRSDRGTRSVAGVVFGADDPRIVRIDTYNFEVRPEGHILFYVNEDRPGMLASVGGILAEAGINIAALALGRKGPGLIALTAVSVDEPIPPDVLKAIEDIEGVRDVKQVRL